MVSWFILLLYVILALLFILVVTAIVYIRWPRGQLEKMGVPIVPAHWLLGSKPEQHYKVIHFEDMALAEKYGPTYGYYLGRVPILFTTDTELIRHIFVKNFDHFHSRRSLELKQLEVKDMLDITQGEKWKVLRNSLSPVFTTGKLKHMFSQMGECINEMIKNLDDQLDRQNTFDVKEIYGCITLDIMGRSVFGMKVRSILDPNSTFVTMAEKMGDFGSEDLAFTFQLMSLFPFIGNYVELFPNDAVQFFTNISNDVMTERRRSGERRNDFLDFLLELQDKLATPDFKRLGIDNNSLIAQALLFWLAGFETSKTTLTTLTYELAKNPDIQERVLNEIKSATKSTDGNITHEILQNLPYLNACISETLRLYAPLVRVERICQKDFEYNGMTIPKGLLVMVPSWALHRNADNYTDPETFDPDRFYDKDRKESLNQYAYLPFGTGPRNCIGMRFALDQIKHTICLLLLRFRFSVCDETQLKYYKGLQFLYKLHPFKLQLQTRS